MGEIVIGRYPYYIEEAERRGARYFNLPMEVWNGMTDKQRWRANQAFLDDAIQRGDAIILATPFEDVGRGYFRKELVYLQSLGYRPSKDGKSLIRTEP